MDNKLELAISLVNPDDDTWMINCPTMQCTIPVSFERMFVVIAEIYNEYMDLKEARELP